jgi:hypothetical protein
LYAEVYSLNVEVFTGDIFVRYCGFFYAKLFRCMRRKPETERIKMKILQKPSPFMKCAVYFK